MPELKNNFIGGKMNTDLDERLTPKGQYIDALNVDVLTSDGGNAGAVHSITGNTLTHDSSLFNNGTCVGMVNDERTDTVYWFVAADNGDYILKYNNNQMTPVVVDLASMIVGGEVDYISGNTVTFDSLPSGVSQGQVIYGTQRTYSRGGQVAVGTVLSVSGNSVTFAFYDSLDGVNDYVDYAFSAGVDPVLEFDKDTPITGINIIDDLLCWTSSISDPRKINITRCIQGTTDITTQTQLVVNGVSSGVLKKEHITVAKKSPAKAPDVDTELTYGELPNTTATINFATSSGDLMEPGTSITITTAIAASYGVGDTILLKETDSVTTALELFPITRYYDVRMLVTSINSTSVTCTISSIASSTTASSVLYAISLLPVEALFEKKFPRFAYRYKFEDGEYSIVGPFTDPVFEAGGFRLTTKEGYNIGMQNRVRKITLKNFVPNDIPKDVIQVDLIYKATESPTLYVIDSIKKDDPTPSGFTNNAWNTDADNSHKGVYDITSETIYKVLPSNQSIRVWDNVPLTALAQEVVGNRLVFANYTQGFDLKTASGENCKPEFTTTLENREQRTGSLIGEKTIKSDRELQLGIAFSDNYLRETPVLTSNSGGVNIPYANAVDTTMLVSSLDTQPPLFADNFRFYIKDNSKPYYNLPLNKIYQTDDGSTWLSFNSSDRNKVDEDTFLVLKNKGGDGGLQGVTDKKYKILDIKSEVPESILKYKTLLGRVSVNSLINVSSGTDLVTDTFFEVGASAIQAATSDKIKTATNLVVRFFDTNLKSYTSYYSIIGAENSSSNNIYKIEGEFKEEVGDLGGSDHVLIYQEENRFKPEYSGRFFVKIPGDSVTNALAQPKAVDDYSDVNTRTLVPQVDSSSSVVMGRTCTVQAASGSQWVTFANTTGITLGMIAQNLKYEQNYVVSDLTSSSVEFTQVGTTTVGITDISIVNQQWLFSNGANVIESEWSDFKSGGTNAAGAWFVDNAYFFRRAEQVTGYDYHESVGATINLLNIPNSDSMDFNPTTSFENSIANSTRQGKGVSGPYSYSGFPHGGFIDIAFCGINDNDYILPDTERNFVDDLRKDGVALRVGTNIYNIIDVSEMKVSNYISTAVEGTHRIYPRQQRRLMVRIYVETAFSPSDKTSLEGGTALDIVKPVYTEQDTYNNEKPAIWETEPKENIDTGVYQAISNYYPKRLTEENIRNYINTYDFITNTTLTSGRTQCIGLNGIKIQASSSFTCVAGDILRVTKHDKSFISVKVKSVTAQTGYNDIEIEQNFYSYPIGFSWYNAFSFGNGVECISIRDEFNSNKLDSGAKASIEYDEYAQEHRKSGLIYSGIYNSTSGVNNLNQFIQGEKITKDLNPSHGSIQKLHARNNDLVAICEDKTYRILANKDALYNADGNPQLISTNNVLGQAVPFAGDRGISTNPESFAVDGYRAYWTHKTSGEVMRLSMDGLTPISRYGRRDYFKTLLASADKIVGSFDNNKGLYNLTVDTTTNAYKEESKGWVSRRSFTHEEGISMANRYFTAYNGELWEWKDDSPINTFHGASAAKSSIKFVVNDSAGSVKSFKTVNYEGDEGWTTTGIDTNIESGTTTGFINEEGMYYSNIKGIAADPDLSSLSVQGMGVVSKKNNQKLTFTSVNTSLDIGDKIYKGSGSTITYVGLVTAFTSTTVTLDDASLIAVSDFALFAKDARVNTGNLKGYYATIELETSNSTLTELFSVNSGVTISSK